MSIVVKFKESEDATKFYQATVSFTGWKLRRPLNSKVEGCVRILYIGETKDDQALYEYLRDLGAFEEMELG